MRPRLAELAGPDMRESRRVRTVAAMLDADETTVRRLIETGELESHTIGKRGVRVYLDSISDYQARQARTARPRPPDQGQAAMRRPRPAAASSAAHSAAKAWLRSQGIL